MNKIQDAQGFVWAMVVSLILMACGGGSDGKSATQSSSPATSAAVSSSASSATLSSSSSIASSSSALSSSSIFTSISASSTSSAITAVTIHYKRAANDYVGWGLHLWGSAISPALVTQWSSPRAFDAVISGWNTVSIPIVNSSVAFNFIVHSGDNKSPVADLSLVPADFGSDVWVVQDNNTLYKTLDEATLALAGIGNASASLDLSAVVPITIDSGLPLGWNKSANFMEIFVRSYKDSNGDGKGDLQGVISKLDYLKDLGVTGIWLMPIMQSSDHDHGYAISDYRKVESDYGSMQDFEMLLSEAHKRGIGIILDYVMNHSSSANPLFLDAATAMNNDKRNWYIFSNTNPGWSSWGGASWHASGTGFYYGVFTSSMPDFNLRNQTVVDYHLNNLRFWLNKGVDGFRFDAAGVLIENGASAWNNQADNHSVLVQAQTVINSYGNRYMICEAPDAPLDYAKENSCGNAFAFGYQSAIKNAGKLHKLESSLVNFMNSSAQSAMPLILGNHDSFAGDRPITELSGNNEADYKVAAAISILASSTPFAYYGEEIGMANGSISGDAALRTPMSWTNAASGFSSVTPYRNLSANIANHNVAQQMGSSSSLLEHYRALYAVRKAYPVLGTGVLNFQSVVNANQFIFTRTTTGSRAAVLINLATTAQNLTVNTGVSDASFTQAYPASTNVYVANTSGAITVSVPAQSAVVLVK
jgi:alpha-amylase